MKGNFTPADLAHQKRIITPLTGIRWTQNKPVCPWDQLGA